MTERLDGYGRPETRTTTAVQALAERHAYTRFAALVLGAVALSEPWRRGGPAWVSWVLWGLVLALWLPVLWAAYLDKSTSGQVQLHSEAHDASRNRLQLNLAGQGPDEIELTTPLPRCY